MKKAPKIRLFIQQTLCEGSSITLDNAQSHYLANVLRLQNGDEICAFDGVSGEFQCRLESISKKGGQISVLKKLKNFYACPDLWLLFAPVKKDKTDFIIEKATELGVAAIMPVITERTISEKIKKERYLAQAIEACEQSRRLDVPQICEASLLKNIFKNWDAERMLYFMDESGQGNDICDTLKAGKGKKAAILVGPEGGFSENEMTFIRKLEFTRPISLGKRILRAETAVAAAISCWQAICGDWCPDEKEEKSK